MNVGGDADRRPPRRSAGATQEEIRRHNLATLLRHLHEHGASSRAELTAVTGLNRSTIGVLTSELEAAGLVEESAPVSSGTAGRPSILVRPKSSRVYVLAVDVGVDRVVAARVGLGGVVLDRREVSQRRDDHDVRTVLGRAARLIAAVRSSAAPDSLCLGLGVSVCGAVRAGDGMVRLAPNLEWVDVPFGSLLAERARLNFPVTVGNDADLGALAEYTRGVAVGSPDLIYLSGEVGVGGGIVTGGRPLSGHMGYGGELGHMVVDPRGGLCRCGARGCWETLVGEDAIIVPAGYRGAGREGVSITIESATGGDRRARAALRKVGLWLGVGIANLVNLFNPEIVIFGGLLGEVFPMVEDDVRSRLDSVAFSAAREDVRLAVAGLGSDSTLLGASELAFAPVLADPLKALGTVGAA